MQAKPHGPFLCEICEESVDRFGTSLNVEVCYQAFTYEDYPTFCSWEHAAEWFAGPPDATTWHRTNSEGFQYGGLIVALVVLALAIFGVISLIMTFI